MNESFRDRLRRLRREGPPEARATADGAAEIARSERTTDRGSTAKGDEGSSSRERDRAAAERAPSGHDAAVPGASDPREPADDATHSEPLAANAASTRPDAGGALPETPISEACSARAPDELRIRLARRSVLLATSCAGDPLAEPELPRRLDLGRPERLAPSRGGALARVSAFAREHAHGTATLESGLVFDRALLAASSRDERFAAIDLERAVYLDTETSGLSGGAGTYVFLVGLGTFDAAGFEVWQGFLDDPRSERALLQETAERIASASAIVSFFGKSFDRHRLEDKMRVHGLVPPFAHVPHLDLYWPLRRAHQGRFENCRLKTLERELAGVAREDDLPGSFAPAAWFDFLGNRPHRLEGVFRHNLEDVLSLVALLPHAAVPPRERQR